MSTFALREQRIKAGKEQNRADTAEAAKIRIR